MEFLLKAQYIYFPSSYTITFTAITKPWAHSSATLQRTRMFGKILAAQLDALRVTIIILPGGKFRYLDRAKLIFWIIGITLILAYWHLGSGGSSYLNLLNELASKFDWVENIMELVVLDILPPLCMFGTILAFSTAWTRYPNHVTENKIPAQLLVCPGSSQLLYCPSQ